MAKQYRVQFVIDGDASKGTKTVRKVREEIDALDKQTGKARKSTRDWSDAAERNASSLEKQRSSIASAKSMAAGFAAVLASIGAAQGLRSSIESFAEFDRRLIAVSKTTDITGVALNKLGAEVQALSRTVPVATSELLDIAQSAGQLGVQGADNILIFTKTIGQLGLASDLMGEAAATSLARILTVTGTAVSNVDRLGATIVRLGNNFAATESEIAGVATRVAQSTAQFDVAASDVLGISAGIKAIGVEAESGGTQVGLAFQAINDALRGGGEQMRVLQRITGESSEALRRSFFGGESAVVFRQFIAGLSRVQAAGGDVAAVLNEMGLGGTRAVQVLGTLATRSEVLEDAMAQANEEWDLNLALSKEAAAAATSFSAQYQLVANAADEAAVAIGKMLAPAVLDALGALREGSISLAENIGTVGTVFQASAVLVTAHFAPAIWKGTQLLYEHAAAASRTTVVTNAYGQVISRTTALQRGLNGTMAALGGPAGLFVIAAAGVIALVRSYETLEERQQAIIDKTKQQKDAIVELNIVQIQQAIAATEAQIAEQQARISTARNQAITAEDIGQRRYWNNQLEMELATLGSLNEVLEAQRKHFHNLQNPVKSLATQLEEAFLSNEALFGSIGRGTETLKVATARTEDHVLAMKMQLLQLRMNDRQVAIHTALVRASTMATGQNIDAELEAINAYYDAVDAIESTAAAQREAEEAADKLREANKRAAEESARDWQGYRESFRSTFADLVLDHGNAMDAIVRATRRAALEMIGSNLFDAGARALGFNVPASAASTAGSGAFAGLMSSFGGTFLDRIANPGAVISKAELAELLGQDAPAAGMSLTELANIGKSIGAGLAGSFAGNFLGESIFGKQAESSWASMAGGTVGAFIGGPLGSFIGSAIGSAVDVAFGGDGKVRSNAGFLAGPTPGLKPEYNAGRHTFASGLEVTLFARRADASQAREILQVFDQVDRSFVDLVKQLGGSVSVSQLMGLDEEANPGSYGAFFGTGGNGTTQGNILAQVNSYIAQLTDHTSGLSDALLETIRSAGSAEEVLAELTKAVAMEAIQDKLDPLRVKTRAYEKDLELLQQVYTEGSAEYIEAARKLKEIHGLTKDSTEDFTRALAGVRSIIDPLNDRIAALTRQIQSDLNTLGGILTDDPLQRLQDLRDQAWDNHREQLRAEEELHKRRLDLAKSLSQFVTDLRLGDLSPLSSRAKFELAQADFRSTLSAALSGDVNAAGRLQGTAQTFAEMSQMMFASSGAHRGNMAEILAGLEQAAGILGSSTFDPQQANNALIVELRAIQDRLIEIPGLMANSMAPLMSSFVMQALASGKTAEQVANTIKGLGGSAIAGADQAMPGFVSSNATPTETITDAVARIQANSGTQYEALSRIRDAAVARGISSNQLAAELGLTSDQLQKNLAILGVPGFRDGGLISGPESGYPVILHGTERITPSGPAAANDPIVQRLDALTQEVAAMRQDYRAGKTRELEMEDKHRRVDEDMRDQVKQLNTRESRVLIG